MNAPTTPPAGGGTSGERGAWGWFAPSDGEGPKRPARQAPTGSGAESADESPEPPPPPGCRWRPLAYERGPYEPQDHPGQYGLQDHPGQHGLQDHPGQEGLQTHTSQHGQQDHPGQYAQPGHPHQGEQREHQRAPEPPDGPPHSPPGGRPAARPQGGWEAPAGPACEAPDRRPASPATPSPDTLLIRRTLAEIEPIADKVTSYFYALLFLQAPGLRALFPAAMDTQRDRLFKALLTAARHADDTATLSAYLSDLGRSHRKYGTEAAHYPAVGESLIGALSRHATATWCEETQAAWVRAYTAISQIMIDAAAEDERTSPAWWHAEIVSHESRTQDVAVVTVRPDQPYPFVAGQYAAVETPWWPRVWRNYSFSCAPRDDGLLSFHIKAVPAGWVSRALVHRAGLGDVIRLGPPNGSMTVDHTTDNGMLCLGGGTGIAPIKALVEDVARHGRSRPVEVFYGARHDDDLYDIDTMLRLQKAHAWLSVRPVVSHGPTLGLSGQLPQVIRKYGPWTAFDAFLSGPPGMIRSGVDTLVGIGIPSHRIRHDSIDDLTASATS
ncbi:flavohemoprotein [Streptomyces cinnamoneus]|uniref:nitric oxide dioxygenase n=2 Tax=Streptomyces cinnamoneus TaxID=53446 RepID=A0A2G1XHD3_STRCJ|nr:globin domain-containing protein [Streptomyces cinnamoneus]PHQ50642.1 flavohemoprotein [Streptomyces cinnamoneus]PPT14103.1 flavohemoprotein [Streptomyces cinnamoneus]